MVLVIAYGNPLRQDDGAGWRVAERVQQLARHAPHIQVLACHQLTPELADLLATARQAFFVDASLEGAPGFVDVRPIAPSPHASAFDIHCFGPADLLATTQALFDAQPSSFLVTITGQDFGYGEQLSAPVEDALDRAALSIIHLVQTDGD